MVVVNGFKDAALVQNDKITQLYRHNMKEDFVKRHNLGIRNKLFAFRDFLNCGKKEYLLQEALDTMRSNELLYK